MSETGVPVSPIHQPSANWLDFISSLDSHCVLGKDTCVAPGVHVSIKSLWIKASAKHNLGFILKWETHNLVGQLYFRFLLLLP